MLVRLFDVVIDLNCLDRRQDIIISMAFVWRDPFQSVGGDIYSEFVFEFSLGVEEDDFARNDLW